jgi:hypothetical protein
MSGAYPPTNIQPVCSPALSEYLIYECSRQESDRTRVDQFTWAFRKMTRRLVPTSGGAFAAGYSFTKVLCPH